ncbi:MAG: CRISPR-associated endonuclease Cas1 [Candidatus Sigynarchaeota archaeon]
MILTLSVPGTTVKRVQESLKVYIPPVQVEAGKKSSRSALGEPSIDGEEDAANPVDDEKRPPGTRIKAKNSDPVDIGNKSAPGNKASPAFAGDNADQGKQAVQGNRGNQGKQGSGEDPDGIKDDAASSTKPVSFQVGISQLSSVIVAGNVSITIPVLQYLAKCAVPVIFTERSRPVAVLNPFSNHGSVRVRKEQFAAIDTERGFHIARKIIGGALENKARLLLGLAKNRAENDPATEKFLRDRAQSIRDGRKKLEALVYSANPVANRFHLLGIEGDGAKEYFAGLQQVIPREFNFTGRNRRPPRDPVNAMLSLGYTILQGYVSIGVAAVGLEPFAGFMHADRSGKPSLVLDMMEEFRQPVVDKLVVSLVTRGNIKPSHFTSKPSGVQLTDAGSDIFIPRLVKRVAPLRPSEEEEGSGSKNYYKEIIKQARDMSRFLLGNITDYEPHLMEW